MILWLALAVLAAPLGVRGDEVARPVPADGKCSVPYDSQWTKAEQFVWDHVCIGEEANFNTAAAVEGYGGDLDPNRSEGLPDSRALSEHFIETLLLKDTYRAALTRKGVRIVGARFDRELDLQNARIGHELGLERSLFKVGVDFSDAITSEDVDLNGSKIVGGLWMERLRADKTVAIKEADFAMLELTGAHIGGDLIVSLSTVRDAMTLNDIEVDRNLWLNGTTLPSVALNRARVRGNLYLSSAKVTGAVEMAGLEVGQTLYMGGWSADGTQRLGTMFSCVLHTGETKASGNPDDESKTGEGFGQKICIDLTSAKIAGKLDLTGSTVGGIIYADSLRIDETARLHDGARFRGGVVINGGKIGGLDASGATFENYLDLTGTAIAGELLLAGPGRPPPQWADGSILVLRNVSADAIQDSADAWPRSLDLIGFTYRNLGSRTQNDNPSLGERGLDSLEAWLLKEWRYSPQPYEQLAGVLRLQGRSDDADEILYAGREQERLTTPSLRLYLTASVLNVVIGYGYHPWRSVRCFLVLWALGAFVQWTRAGIRVTNLRDARSQRALARDLPRHFVYSFEMLLPVVRFRGQTRDFPFGWQDIYFHIHGLIGLALAAFLGAGLAGLTK